MVALAAAIQFDDAPVERLHRAVFFLCVWVVYGILILGDDERAMAT